MTRTILFLTGPFGASTALLADAAVKGAALLLLATVAAVVLKHRSAATRHFVWLLAIVALLVIPLLSLVLPRWRVLPEWAGVLSEIIGAPNPPSLAAPADRARWPAHAEPANLQPPPAAAHEPATTAQPSSPALATPPAIPAIENQLPQDEPRAQRARPWVPTPFLSILPLAWTVGLCVLLLRLSAARWLLRNAERQAAMLERDTRDPLITALNAASEQLDVRRPITLLINPDKSIPVVWGIRRCRLLLPAAARNWPAERLRSVLLHELAHVKRRDMIAQLLAELACALHWFNPLAWFAAWRLAEERERACDDLVLAGGVRPSTYAEHLLDIATSFASARRVPGLAMARKSSLEGRLLAVLSGNLNRARVSAARAAVALAVAAALVIPIAMLRAADDKPAEAPKPKAADVNPKNASKLDPATEERLAWGEPVNGLRAAIIIRNASDKPKPGDLPDLYIVLQNVSKAALNVTDLNVPANVRLRELRPKKDGRTLFILGVREPPLGDVTLAPREVAYLPMFDAVTKLKVPTDPTLNEHTLGAHIAEDVLKDPHQSLVAAFQIDNAPAGGWTGKLVTGDATGALAAVATPLPRDKQGRALFNLWLDHARNNGNFPGGLVGRLGDNVKLFIKNNTGDKGGDAYAKKMTPLLPRFEASRDWTPAEVVALMDDVAAVTPVPLDMMATDMSLTLAIKTGQPLPKDLTDAPWGDPQPNGLRLAWLFEPRAAEHPIGTALKGRLLIYNGGKDRVVFRAHTWNQGNHEALDANGPKLKVEAIEWLTLSRLVPVRLAPGEYVEMHSTGIGVGTMKEVKDRGDARVGSYVHAKPGDDVTITTAPIQLKDWNEQPGLGGGPRWWLDLITTHLAQSLPLPADAEERKHLVYRAGMQLFGTPLSAEEINVFVNDREPTALDSLAKRLAQRSGTTPFAGSLTSAPTKFRVLPADAARQPGAAAPDPRAPKLTPGAPPPAATPK
jgi:beta-lactamase regulating signal transducer with metallopeptidase domain